ncbi:MAG: DUF2500 domain-containing protein [Bacillota bacterium]
MSPFDSGPFGFSVFNLMFTVVPLLVVGVFLYVIGSNIYRAMHNRQQPLLTRRARIVGRRQRVSRHHHNNHHHTHTAYFVTFEFEDSSREEFSMRGDQYAMLAEGDIGTLQSQGTWFKGFDREYAM